MALKRYLNMLIFFMLLFFTTAALLGLNSKLNTKELNKIIQASKKKFLKNKLTSTTKFPVKDNITSTKTISFFNLKTPEVPNGYRDLTNEFTFYTNSRTSPDGQGLLQLIDNDLSTKFLAVGGTDFNPIGGNGATVLIIGFKSSAEAITKPITAYGLGTGDDQPGRDPRDWLFQGSNDSIKWNTLDERKNQFTSGSDARDSLFIFKISNPTNLVYRYYRIYFIDSNGGTSFDFGYEQISELRIYDSPPSPSTPTLSLTTTTRTSATVNWVENTILPVVSYNIQRSFDGVNFRDLASGLPITHLSYIDTNLIDSANYYYRIKANGADTVASQWSNIVKATTLFKPDLPLIPGNLTFIASTDSTLYLRWTRRSNNVVGYKIERSLDSLNFSLLDSTKSIVNTFTDSLLHASTKYFYRIYAYNKNGASLKSNIVSAYTTGARNTAPLSLNPIINRKICGGIGLYQFSESGFTFGSLKSENWQTIKAISIASDSASFFTSLFVNPLVSNGIITYRFTTSGKAKLSDSCNIFIKVKDNGGTFNGGVDSTIFIFRIFFVPININITTDQINSNLPRYSTVNLTANSNFPQYITYKWDDADGIVSKSTNLLTLTVKPTKKTTYTITGTTSVGCQASSSITITPIDSLVVANVLTPNGDGINDKWIIWGIDNNLNVSVNVFNSVGQLVFTSKKYDNNWDGTFNGSILPNGVYYYTVNTGKGETIRGTLNIIR